MKNTETEGLQAIAGAIHLLGTADAATPMGALEALGVSVKEGNEAIAWAIRDLAEAVRELAEAQRK